MQRRWMAAVLGLVAVAGCSSAPQPSPAPAPAVGRPLSGALRWMRRSAEYRALTRETYAAATARVEQLAPAMSGAAWGVILDADETVLDNSMYEVRRAAVDSAYTEASWSAWVRDTAAGAVPGAVAFTQRVHALGGRVVIVTNRADSLCAPTRLNLRKVGVMADLVLCQPPGPGDKNPRFEAVERGTASPTLPALDVVAWVGDNIQDFPRLTQASRADSSALALFGRRYFVLPNPVYGSWESDSTP
ncbi:MAG TPA: HAD family acid phosphatase [Gemmatimonadaceae bacterium]|nr:HAD family acid phosphatase [Gemmatimonadaceae bacterium]